MSSTMAFADRALEKDFLAGHVLCQRPFCNLYHGLSFIVSGGALCTLLVHPPTGTVASELVVIHAVVMALSVLALWLLNMQPAGFQLVSKTWHVLHRIVVCVRCADIRSVWYTVPGSKPFLTPSFTLHFFFTAMFCPVLLHCFGLPLPTGLSALSAAAMLAVIWSSNASYCRALSPAGMWCMFGVSPVIEDHVLTQAAHMGKAVKGDIQLHEDHNAVMCQAKLGMAQASFIVFAVVGGMFLEVYRRRMFLGKKRACLPCAIDWPFGSIRLVMHIAFDVLIVVAGFGAMCQIYMWHLASQLNG